MASKKNKKMSDMASSKPEEAASYSGSFQKQPEPAYWVSPSGRPIDTETLNELILLDQISIAVDEKGPKPEAQSTSFFLCEEQPEAQSTTNCISQEASGSSENLPEPAHRQSPRKRLERKITGQPDWNMILLASQTIGSRNLEEKEPELMDQSEAVPAAPEPVRQEKKKVTLKSLQALEKIALEVLQTLSQKMLIELFATRLTECEYSRKIIFICHFHADKQCGEKFTAHRNEITARNMIEKHIRDHIEEEAEKGQPFFTNSLEYRRKQKVASKKKVNAPLKKPRKSPPPKENKPKVENEVGEGEPSPVTEKKSRKRKKMDDKENQTSGTLHQNEKGSPKRARRSTSSEDSMEAGGAQEVEARQEGDRRVPVPYSDHSYAVPPGVVPVPERARSPSASSDSSVSSGVSLDEPGTPPENEDRKDALSGHPFATQEETVHETVAHEPLGSDEDKKILNRTLIQRKKKQEEIPKHIKDLAQGYIEGIQSKKKDENYPLVCKICNTGKVFTAAASLINHYRSHAGIKLFKCHCGLAFTRKHSLKYHELIHWGEYNFACDYCKRPFRHKSHYKEHLRKHTGETPFVCYECDPVARYKTRNTYKRHLKTHHGKILSRTGTIKLSEEEFAKVRTKKYKKSSATGAAVPKSSSSSESSSSPKVEPEELKAPTQQMPLPPVATILPGLNPVTSQASLGILPPMGAMQAAAPGSLLGMNTAGHGLVYSAFPNPLQTSILVPQVNLGTGQPANMSVSQAASIIVCQAPGMTVCQSTGIVSRDAQEQTYYTITGFAPGMVVGSAPSLYGAQPTYQQGSGSGDTDLTDYKPVGYATHSHS